MTEGPREGSALTKSILAGAYNQTYVIRAMDKESTGGSSKDAESPPSGVSHTPRARLKFPPCLLARSVARSSRPPRSPRSRRSERAFLPPRVE